MFEFEQDCGLQIIKELVEGEENLSRIYGFILYNEQNPYVVKVLQDDVFWNSLNSISGSNWPIFAVRPFRMGRHVIKGGRPGSYSMLVSVWEEPGENIPVLRDFALEDTQELPLFVAFMWDDEDYLHEVSIPIRGTDTDSTYRSLEEIVKVVTEAESQVEPEYKRSVNVFRNVKDQFDSLDYKYRIIDRGKIIKKIADFLSAFVKL